MVQLRQQTEANFATVAVTVEDENDNPPLFEKVYTLCFFAAFLPCQFIVMITVF